MKNFLLCIALVFCLRSNSQTYITIPDANFASWLQTNFPSAMNGNQMNINSPSITSTTMLLLANKSISDLTGVQYFTSLQHLECEQNTISSLPPLPSTLQHLWCYQNQLTSLPSLPNGLITLNCDANSITNLPALPNNLLYLRCAYNQLSSLPVLPSQLDTLSCYYNSIANVANLPSTIRFLEVFGNQITALPTLPTSLEFFDCSYNLIASMPSLPNSLIYLNCDTNQILALPSLPSNLQYLSCSKNQLTTLPVLPNGLVQLECAKNNITCFGVFPSSISYINIAGNPFCCLPNYLPSMPSYLYGLPLCSSGNTNGCPIATGILGTVFLDSNNNCLKNSGEATLRNVKLNLYNSSNFWVGQTITASNGVYNFGTSPGNYKVVIDTANMPFRVQCNYPGIDSSLTVSTLDTAIDFPVTCKNGFDIGVQSIHRAGAAFPGLQHTLSINAGEMANWYGMHCATGVSGQITVSVTGKVTYVAPNANALTPVVSGNTFTYSISDFGSVNNNTDFALIFLTDTTAQMGDTICVNVTVTPTIGDNDTTNNFYHFCYLVSNSYDPNLKEVFPIDVPVGYSDWFTYTVHFQNTGNAPAQNIRLLDTLDNNLDLSTFNVIGYSHPNNTYLNGNKLTVYFPNIMLPDSLTNNGASMGYIQYRIKARSSWTFPNKIKNTAYIYFDYNPPVSTNTTLNSIETAVGIKQNETQHYLQIYPNPTNDFLHIRTLAKNAEIRVVDLTGRMLIHQRVAGDTEIDVRNLTSGLYLVQMNHEGMIETIKLIKE